MSQNGSKSKKQAMDALAKANKVRMDGAQLRRELRSGDLSLEAALRKRAAQPMKVGYVIESLPRWGPRRAHKLYRRLEFRLTASRDTRIRDLTKREKELIVQGVKDPDFWVL